MEGEIRSCVKVCLFPFFSKPVYIRETTVSLSLRGGETPKHSRKKRSVCFKKKLFLFGKWKVSLMDEGGRTREYLLPFPLPTSNFILPRGGEISPTIHAALLARQNKVSFKICFKTGKLNHFLVCRLKKSEIMRAIRCEAKILLSRVLDQFRATIYRIVCEYLS